MSDKGVKRIKCGDELSFFAAANSGDGFKSFYGDIFGAREIERRYLIKGGPGTGKSTFMRRIAALARKKGCSVEYYRCSSDPASLDGLIIAGRVAFVDATSPHCVEPELAGARDEIVDLGAFWDPEALAMQKEEIARLSRAKSACYKEAYGYLSGAKSVKNALLSGLEGCFDEEKLKKYAKRLLGAIPKGNGYHCRIGLCSSVGMTGRARLDSYEQSAKSVCVINDFLGGANRLFCMLAEGAKKRKNAIRISYDPLLCDRIDALLFEDSGTLFVLCKDEKSIVADKNIYMKRFANTAQSETGDILRRYRENERLCEKLVCAAEKSLARAGKYHFELESIYKLCMDFDSLESFSRAFCERIGGTF